VEARDARTLAWIVTVPALFCLTLIVFVVATDGMPEPDEMRGAVVSCVAAAALCALAAALWADYRRRYRR